MSYVNKFGLVLVIVAIVRFMDMDDLASTIYFWIFWIIGFICYTLEDKKHDR